MLYRDNNKVIRFWHNWFTAKSDRREFKEINNFWESRYYDFFEKFIDVNIPSYNKGGLKVLAAGSGSGADALRLCKNGNQVTLLDGSTSALNYSKTISNFANKKLNYINGDLFNLPFNSQGYDLVFNIGVVEEYELPQSVIIIKEMKRVTKSKGFIVIGVPNPRNPEIVYSRFTGKWKTIENNYTEKHLNKMMIEAGLSNVKINYIPTLFAFGYFDFLKPLFLIFPKTIPKIEGYLKNFGVVIVGIGQA
jgi:SAM-dependent methyltransferase